MYYLQQKRSNNRYLSNAAPANALTDDGLQPPVLRRSNSQTVRNTRDEVIFEIQEELADQIYKKEVEIHDIQKEFDHKVEALTVDMSVLRSQLPSNKYKCTKKFQVLPGFKVENSFQYPDMLSLTQKSFDQLHPMKLGFN